MATQVPLVNGVRHSWASIELVLFGITITGITAISYKQKSNKTNEYGAGSEPVHRGEGNTEYESSITLMKYEIDRIQDALPAGQSLKDILPFSISVVYKPTANDILRYGYRPPYELRYSVTDIYSGSAGQLTFKTNGDVTFGMATGGSVGFYLGSIVIPIS